MSDNEMKHIDLSLLVVGADAIGGITAALIKKTGTMWRLSAIG
jgi:hypothetical protein